MKRTIMSLFLIVFVIGIIAYFLFESRQYLTGLPNDNEVRFTYTSTAISDDENNLYIIDQSKRRIVISDSKGNLKNIIKDESLFEELNYLYTEIEVAHGDLYVLKSILDDGGYSVVREEILRYKKGGTGRSELVYYVDYNSNERPARPGRLKALQLNSSGDVFFYSVNKDNAVLKKIAKNVKNGAKDEFSLPVTENELLDITGYERGATYFSTRKGEIFRVNAILNMIKIYPRENEINQQESIPENLMLDSAKRLYFTDALNREIKRVTLQNKQYVWENILSTEKIKNKKDSMEQPLYRNIYLKNDGSIIVVLTDVITDNSNQSVTNEYLISLQKDSNIKNIPLKANYPIKMIAYHWLAWGMLVIAVILLGVAWRIIYIYILKRRISLIIKQLVIFIPLIIISLSAVAYISFSDFSDKFLEETENRLGTMVNFGIRNIDAEKFEQINSPSDYMSKEYIEVADSINSVLKAEMDVTLVEEGVLYSALYKLKEYDGKKLLTISMFNDNTISPAYPYDDANQAYFEVAENKSGPAGIKTVSTSDTFGDWIFAIGPIKNQYGEVVGVYETGMDLNGFSEYRRNLIYDIAKGVAGVSLLLIIVFLIMTYFLLRPLGILKKGVAEVAAGNLNITLNVKTGDEGEDLCEGFNSMAENIRGRILKIMLMQESYSRFVPRQFRKYLEKNDVVDFERGDQAKHEMSIMFVNIREFFALAEGMTVEQSFNFINSYLERIGPLVPKNRGFVNKYLGAGIMALFGEKPEDALEAAVQMREALFEYNKHRVSSGYTKIDFGIGIHRSQLMIGIIGEEKRLEGTVISEGVNLTETLEKISAKLGASILVTAQFMNCIEGREDYEYRNIGRVKLLDKDEPIEVLDVFQGDDTELNRLKRETKGIFEAGVSLYQSREFIDARAKFIEVIKNNHRDEAAKIYFFLCDEYLQKGVPGAWDGSISV